jgi:RNA polymerase sigma-70 factor, ECF subfamily
VDDIDDELQRFRVVFTDAYPAVLRFVQRRADPAQAEDVAAEAFLVAWRRIGELPVDLDDARAWLFGIARNCLLNEQRSQRRRTALAVRLACVPESGVSADPAAGLVDRMELSAAWLQLSADEQEALALTVFEQLASAQAGAVLGISATAYRIRLSRARTALRRHLDGVDTTPALEEANT